MASPLAILMLILLDLIYLLNTAYLEPTFELIYLLSYGMVDLTFVPSLIENSYSLLFGMEREDVEGFRRMRTTH